MLRASLIIASILNVLFAGVATVSLERASGLELSAPILGVFALTLQGGFSLLYLATEQSAWAPFARVGLLAGEAAALAVGGAIAVSALLYNLNPVAGDLELAPLFFGAAFSGHAALALVHLAVDERQTVT